MRFEYKRSFDRWFKKLRLNSQQAVEEAIGDLMEALQTGKAPPIGLGLTKLTKRHWEIRSSLKDRIIFSKIDGTVSFLLVGNHDDVERFLRN